MSEHIRSASSGGVLQLTIERPEKKNALDRAMYRALADALDSAKADPAIRAVLLTGANGVFSAGNDIADFASAAEEPEGAQTNRLIETVLQFTKPIVAAVDGIAVGIGTTILLHCDLVYATEAARLRLPFIDLGLVPEFASSNFLPRLVGLQRASEMLLLGDFFTATDAHAMGLVNRIVPASDLLATAHEACRRIATKSPQAVAITRRLLRGDPQVALARAREEAEHFVERLSSPEAKAAFAAFLARR